MVVDRVAVWAGYLALHRYLQSKPTPSDAPVPTPRSLPPAPLTRHAADCDRIGGLLTRLDDRLPIPLLPPFYAYLFLFVQAQRCSMKLGPVYLPGKGWRNIGWFPLASLRGRDDVAERTWVGWYKAHIQSRQASMDDIRHMYPWVPTPQDRAGVVRHQRELFRRYGVDAEVFIKYGLDGQPRHSDVVEWDSWLMMSEPTSWQRSPLVQLLKPELVKLANSPDWKHFCGIVEDRVGLGLVLDRVLANTASNPNLIRQWRRARKGLLSHQRSPVRE